MSLFDIWVLGTCIAFLISFVTAAVVYACVPVPKDAVVHPSVGILLIGLVVSFIWYLALIIIGVAAILGGLFVGIVWAVRAVRDGDSSLPGSFGRMIPRRWRRVVRGQDGS